MPIFLAGGNTGMPFMDELLGSQLAEGGSVDGEPWPA
jgi:hypothetical protein